VVIGCSQEVDPRWEAAHEECIAGGREVAVERNMLDREVDELIKTSCANALNQVGEKYSDPNDVPQSEREEAINDAIEDCLSTDILESESC
jgi:hypothetical protein